MSRPLHHSDFNHPKETKGRIQIMRFATYSFFQLFLLEKAIPVAGREGP
jgi:hypothetical protein